MCDRVSERERTCTEFRPTEVEKEMGDMERGTVQRKRQKIDGRNGSIDGF